MTILFEAWRRTHGKSPRLAETLGAPTVTLREPAPLLPWLLCLLLIACVAGLGVYVWLDLGSRNAAAVVRISPPAIKNAPVVAGPPAAATARPALQTHRQVANRGAGTAQSGASAALRSGPPPAIPTAVHERAPMQDRAKSTMAQAATSTTIAFASAPDGIREAMPALAIVAHVWNENPDARFVMIGGRVYRAGDELAPGLRLLAITREGEVVGFRGYRIALP